VTISSLREPNRFSRSRSEEAGLSGWSIRRAEAYLGAQGLRAVFLSGDPTAIAPNPLDLAFLHRIVRRKRPRAIVELGCGNSTIAFAHALAANYKDALERLGSDAVAGCVYAVDTSPHWIANTQRKLRPELQGFAHFQQSEAEVRLLGGDLCHLFRELPNLCPDLIFVDGPQSNDVAGTCHGLGFITEARSIRPQVTADPLLYESSLSKGALILVDGRKSNTLFLRRALKRRYRFKWNASPGLHRFELVE
jgi:SAM-dependent methyltransferase